MLAAVLAPKVNGGLVKKNIRKVNGTTLVELAVQAAFESSAVDKVLVVTDDSDTTTLLSNIQVESSKDSVFKHPERRVEIDKCGVSLAQSYQDFDYFVLLDISTPLRLPKDIDSALELSVGSKGEPVVTVSDTGLSAKNLLYMDSDRGLEQIKVDESNEPSRDRKLYECNYSVLVASKQYLLSKGTFFSNQTRAYLIPKDRALYVDSKLDLAIVETLVTKKFFQLPSYIESKALPKA